MTYRQIAEFIREMPEEVKDKEAIVFLPDNYMDEEFPVKTVRMLPSNGKAVIEIENNEE